MHRLYTLSPLAFLSLCLSLSISLYPWLARSSLFFCISLFTSIAISLSFYSFSLCLFHSIYLSFSLSPSISLSLSLSLSLSPLSLSPHRSCTTQDTKTNTFMQTRSKLLIAFALYPIQRHSLSQACSLLKLSDLSL